MALTRDTVVETAVRLLTQYGLADLSMRRLARELDVQVGALYWHVASKQELLVDVAAHLLAKIPDNAPSQEITSANDDDVAWVRQELSVVCHSIFDALLPIPDSADVVQWAAATRPEALRAVEILRDLLTHLPVEPTRIHAATSLLLHHIVGNVAELQNATMAVGEDQLEARRVNDRLRESFEWGLERVLDALA
ncbi:AcrR family transcriptional regulator [Neomicrococcus aestuarii]|uniref:AcrR family transcriptional regulator n=1 Tax=Neomicrococcus aestuarii TaxID=556325 RepID=A0A7W8WZT0_9MICC|nr:helix-turn-helix domain-containing protein [Neomicrococcus aestuarii]MBB5512572.1 AcrR family transcriptional regulator [Neomicrococcus aestuarii]